jgi:hypothetical protein
MNILILEDDPDRIKHFKRNLIGHYVAVFDRVEDFIYTYNRKDMEWDLVFLDYDLDSLNGINPEVNNGIIAVHKMLENVRTKPHYIIHSANEIAAAYMCDLLRNRIEELKCLRYYGIWHYDDILDKIKHAFATDPKRSIYDKEPKQPYNQAWLNG